MKVIWKYELEPHIVLKIPKGGRILDLQTQFGNLCIWVLVDPGQEVEDREFTTFGTGDIIKDDFVGEYVGTFHTIAGSLLFHVFEIIKEGNENSS